MSKPVNTIRKYVVFMALLAAGHAAAGVIVFFYPERILSFLNFFPENLNAYEVLPVAIASETRLWLVPAASFDLFTALICATAAIRPAASLLPWLVVTAKLIAGAGFVFLFIEHSRSFAYLAMGVVEAALALAIVWFTARASIARRNRSRAAAASMEPGAHSPVDSPSTSLETSLSPQSARPAHSDRRNSDADSHSSPPRDTRSGFENQPPVN